MVFTTPGGGSGPPWDINAPLSEAAESLYDVGGRGAGDPDHGLTEGEVHDPLGPPCYGPEPWRGPGSTVRTVYVEGCEVSSALEDTSIRLLVAPCESGEFTVHATQAVTVVSVTKSPGEGGLGGTLTLNLSVARVEASCGFYPSGDAATWERVHYPDGPGGLSHPGLLRRQLGRVLVTGRLRSGHSEASAAPRPQAPNRFSPPRPFVAFLTALGAKNRSLPQLKEWRGLRHLQVAGLEAS